MESDKRTVFACTALFVSSFLFIYIHNAPKYALTRISGNDTSILAEFNALFMPVFVVDLFAGFTMRMWLTRMAVYHNDGDCGSFKKTINKQLGVITGLTVLSMAGMFFLEVPFLLLYTELTCMVMNGPIFYLCYREDWLPCILCTKM